MAHDDWNDREFEVANAKLLEGSMVFESTGIGEEKSVLVIGPMANGKDSYSLLKTLQNNHLLFCGNQGSGKTNRLKKALLNDINDFKLLINPSEEYIAEVDALKDRGYTVIDAYHFDDELDTEVINDVQKNTVLLLNTIANIEDYDINLHMLVYDMYQRAIADNIKMNVFIDGEYQVLNSMPVAVMLARKAKIYAAVQDINRVNQHIQSRFAVIECGEG